MNNQNVIEFFDFNNERRKGRMLEKCSISIWYNLKKGKQATYGCTLSNDIDSDHDHVKIGKIGSDLCIVFSDNGIKLYGKNRKEEKKGNLVFNSKEFVKMIFPEMNEDSKDRKVFELNKINDQVYIIKNQSK